MTGAAGLDGERGGVKVALRECSRLMGGRDRARSSHERAGDQDERPLLLKSCRVRRGALEALGPGSPGVFISEHSGC